MSQTITNLIESTKPKLDKLSKEEHALYKAGLKIFESFMPKNFLDLEMLSDDTNRHQQDGIYYHIPYLHGSMLASVGNKIDLLIIYDVKDHVLECPLRISFEITNKEKHEYTIYVHDQTRSRTMTYTLIEAKDSGHYTDLKGVLDNKDTLSDMLHRFQA